MFLILIFVVSGTRSKPRIREVVKTFLQSSLPKEEKLRIDTLRNIIPVFPVVVGEEILLPSTPNKEAFLHTTMPKVFPHNIQQSGKQFDLHPDSLSWKTTDYMTDLMYGNEVIVSLTDLDGLCQPMKQEASSVYENDNLSLFARFQFGNIPRDFCLYRVDYFIRGEHSD